MTSRSPRAFTKRCRTLGDDLPGVPRSDFLVFYVIGATIAHPAVELLEKKASGDSGLIVVMSELTSLA